jgi:hypothetical protein
VGSLTSHNPIRPPRPVTGIALHVLYFITSTHTYSYFILNCVLLLSRQPLWPSGQSSWLQIRRPAFDSRRYQIFWTVVGLERGPISLVSTIEELVFERKSSGSGPYGRRDPSRWPSSTLYQQKLALTLLTSGGRLVGIVRSRTKAAEWVWLLLSQHSPGRHIPCICRHFTFRPTVAIIRNTDPFK